ncbi:hypothetical protein G6F22_017378 [Rhizopus arrhizus]|nr:hypothetical protein G6F22_017378 [Rhizopus arrhizus]KAG0923564.1 hypothetical protein G6F31_019456 [Rhizopus arrhizus]
MAPVRAAVPAPPDHSRPTPKVSWPVDRQTIPSNVLQERRTLILGRKHRRTYRPVHGDVCIIPADASIGLLYVDIGAEIVEQRRFRQHSEAVREPFRNPELSLVFGAQDHRLPAPEGRRAAADVHCDVIDLTLQHRNQLALWARPLIVKATQHASA